MALVNAKYCNPNKGAIDHLTYVGLGAALARAAWLRRSSLACDEANERLS